MSNALLASVSGLKAHQKMLDVAGNNLANLNTNGFKASRISFVDLLSETLQEASQPTTLIGGTNPQQIGSGVAVGAIDRDTTQGSLVNTGQSLDMAIEGAGFFVLNNGKQDVYTRVGSFAVDSEYYLVDPATGYRVQRIGSEGVVQGFQDSSNGGIRVPFDVALEAKATEAVVYTGNLSADEVSPSTSLLASGMQYTSAGASAAAETRLIDLDQGGDLVDGDVITFTGTNPDGTAIGPLTLTIDTATTTFADLINMINDGESIAEQYQGQVAHAVGSAAAAYITATGANSNLSITFDGVTRSIGSTDLGTADVLVDGLNSGESLTLAELVTAINTAFNGQTGTVSGTLGDIASAVDLGGSNYVLQVQAAGTAYGAITDFALDGQTVGDVEFAGGGTDVTTATFDNTVDGSYTAGLQGATASVLNGEIRVLDDDAGYSQTDVQLEHTGTGAMTLPKYFKMLSVGGEVVKETNVEIFDSQGIGHVMSAAFVRSETNVWDMVVTSIDGDVELVDRRINDITFLEDGSFGGLDEATNDSAQFSMKFAHDPNNTRVIALNFGTVGEVVGLSQFGGSSTVSASGQDGYASGWLSDVSVTGEGTLMGVFTNGIRQPIAALQLAVFQNAAGLTAIGTSYYSASANSGDAVPTEALASGAGTIHGGSLEQSNVDTAEEFVNLIQAQNGYQANARAIQVTNEMLQELTNLIR
jgi:flagellar hook protein FlgE